MYLLDTNHCSAILEGNQKIADKLSDPSIVIVTCTITMGELIYMVKNSEKSRENEVAVRSLLNDITILEVDQKVADTYGELKAKLINKFGPKDKKKRRSFKFKEIGVSDNDLWIASIGISQGAIIVSQDSDFARIKEVHHFDLECWI